MPVQKVPAEDAETVRDAVGEEAAAIAEAVPAVEDQQTNATATPVASTAIDDHQAQEGTTQEGTYVVRRTEEYSYPDSDEEKSVDLPTNPPVPTVFVSTSRDQIPTSDPPPVPSSTASDRDAHNQALPAAGCDDDETDDWLHYPEYDPIYQLIPQGFRPLTEKDEANRDWPNYDSEQ